MSYQIARTKVVFVSFATVKKPCDADVLVKARGKSLKALRSEILSHCPPPVTPSGKDGLSQSGFFHVQLSPRPILAETRA